MILRDAGAECEALDRLLALGFRIPRSRLPGPDPESQPDLELAPGRLPAAVAILSAEGWTVEAAGKLYRSAGRLRLSVSSGIDWFDLAGAVDFGGKEVALPAILAAVRRSERTVVIELQMGKRALADAIITADNSLIRDLTREDLELLLS